MKAHIKISIAATCGLATALLSTPLYAQVPPGTVTPGQVPPASARQGVMTGIVPGAQAGQTSWAGQEAQLLIGHAVSMAIDGTALESQRRAASAEGRSRAGGSADGPARQLMTYAQNEMQESQRLLEHAGRDQAVSQPLRNAASGYINTLFALSGGAAREDGDQQGVAKLSDNERAALCLINHSVCEVLTASQLVQLTRMMGSTSASGEQLQRHAQQMMSEGRETLQRFLSQANAERGNREGGQVGRQGEASVMALAQRGREVIDALQMSGGQPAGALGAPATGTIRGNTIPGAGRRHRRKHDPRDSPRCHPGRHAS